jgi:hypothetical protein
MAGLPRLATYQAALPPLLRVERSPREEFFMFNRDAIPLKLSWRSSRRRQLILVLGLALASATILAAHPERASALCSGHAIEHGDWVNADPNASGIARIELRDCQSVTTCSGNICSTKYDAGWTMRVFGKCSPTNCDWGWTSGALRLSSGQIPGYYNQGFAKRYVYAAMSAYRPGQLWVYWRTDFTDPSRPDYEKQEWFKRA